MRLAAEAGWADAIRFLCRLVPSNTTLNVDDDAAVVTKRVESPTTVSVSTVAESNKSFNAPWPEGWDLSCTGAN